MNVGDRLTERARLHAALADVTRLRLMDVLNVGDASTSELVTELGVPSNLLAHHVNVLVEVGLVTRRKSEGDARRTYLTLGTGRRWLDGAAGALQLPPRAPRRVLFVDDADAARARLAAALWRRASPVPAAAAGTHPGERIHPEALAVAARHGVAIPEEPPRALEEVARRGDLVVTVCDRAHEELGGKDRLHWAVPDPALPGSAAAFEEAFAEISDRVSALASHWSPSVL